jgi:hypothetical protein
MGREHVFCWVPGPVTKGPYRVVVLRSPSTDGNNLYKMLGFHGGDYEECRHLGHKNPVRTTRETHYVSATESSRLMLCKI